MKTIRVGMVSIGDEIINFVNPEEAKRYFHMYIERARSKGYEAILDGDCYRVTTDQETIEIKHGSGSILIFESAEEII